MLTAETRAGVLVLTLNRPERRNAMVPELMVALADALRAAAESADHRAVVTTGAGAAFCVGADLTWLGSLADPAEGVAELVAAHHGVVRALRAAPVPVVAAVNGAAAGGGLSLALAADYRVAAETATFTTAYFRLGLPPDGGTSAFLVRSLGAARAMELLLTGRTLTASEALGSGLVNEVTAPEGLVERACAAAAGFAAAPRETLLATRRLLDLAGAQPLEAQLDAEEAAMRAAARRDEFRTGLAAFLARPR